MARKFKWAFLTLSLILLAGIGYYTYAFLDFANNIQGDSVPKFGTVRPSQVTKTSDTLVPPKWEGKERVNILLLGGDSRGMTKNEIPRSDSIMVASIDPVTKKAYLFSILRDTYVKIPGHGEDRINTAVATGGPKLAMKTVSDLLGIPIQYYVYTDFKGFIALVDALGGIELDVEKDMKYRDKEDGPEYDIDLKKGVQQLDGKKALQYVRFRHDALSDFSRTERQRKFLQAVATKMQSTSSLIRLPKILSSIDPYIETNLSTMDMIKLGSLGYEAKTEGMISQQIPPQELLAEKRVGGADVISVNKDKLQVYLKALFDGRDPIAAMNEKTTPAVPASTTTKSRVTGGTGTSTSGVESSVQ
jgi:polyisoprenyl-teichoic acid--peptidoglycan teichoic acid transferase